MANDNWKTEYTPEQKKASDDAANAYYAKAENRSVAGRRAAVDKVGQEKADAIKAESDRLFGTTRAPSDISAGDTAATSSGTSGIPAERFKYLDEETNVPTVDFAAVDSSDPFNTNLNTLDEIKPDLASFIDNNKQVSLEDIGGDLAGLQTGDLSENIPVRGSKDILGAIKDLSKLSKMDIDGLLAGMIPDNPMFKSTIGRMGQHCRSNAASHSGAFGRPYNNKSECGGSGGKNGCTSGEFGRALSDATNGAYNKTTTDLNGILNAIVSLSKFGYDLNMCGVFSSLSNTLTDGIPNPTNLLSRASGSLLSHLSNTGNIKGALDLASSSVGLNTTLENPEGLTAFGDFTTPEEIPESGFSGFGDRILGAFDIFHGATAFVSNTTGALSSAILGKTTNSLSNIFKGKLANMPFDSNDIDAIPRDDFAFINSAYGNNPDPDCDFALINSTEGKSGYESLQADGFENVFYVEEESNKYEGVFHVNEEAEYGSTYI